MTKTSLIEKIPNFHKISFWDKNNINYYINYNIILKNIPGN